MNEQTLASTYSNSPALARRRRSGRFEPAYRGSQRWILQLLACNVLLLRICMEEESESAQKLGNQKSECVGPRLGL
jgi:hypothetical protein